MSNLEQTVLFQSEPVIKTREEHSKAGIPIYSAEFWTAKQRQANSIHEISYRACYKPQLPAFFIDKYSKTHDVVYDPFSGRGTTVLQAGLMNRAVIANDLNPLSTILCKSRFFIPEIADIEKRLSEISFINKRADIDLSMFFQEQTEKEIVSMQTYFMGKECDDVDNWIRMVATNRLTGHSKGFFSVFTLPPNQAAKPESQKKINERYNTQMIYKDTKQIILKKTKDLLRDINLSMKKQLRGIGEKGLFINEPAHHTPQINSGSVNLIVTSPPFLDIVDYESDNWLRNWFNGIQTPKLTVVKKLDEWEHEMYKAFIEFYRVLTKQGVIAFEVGEVRKGHITLDENVLQIGVKAGLKPVAIFRNQQSFTKTANIWGVDNNTSGTNSNRIVVFTKE